ncbi:futalosine hydrolase [Paenibacillus turpanensis]|uniref:futalosine hydrolase n=1 Tax=Paenibacillus turpanensis TaxID=2689078 RepID=UPI001FB60451|nr:futalosine hydrolase [Paenibacillus turpanensis]
MQPRILIVTAVDAEKEAVMRGLQGDERFAAAAVGVGPAAAAARTAALLAASTYSLVISAGIGGGFAGRADIGSLVVASEIIAADLGAETQDGFLSVDELGFGSSRIAVDSVAAKRIAAALEAAGLPLCFGPVLTVTTATGTAARAEELARRNAGAAAEAMEGFGVAAAANDRGIPVLELRAVSNRVGPRDRSAWRIPEALHALEQACKVLTEVLT